MSPSPRLSPSASQRLALAPRQSEALRLLAMPAIELERMLEEALEQNAMLEREEPDFDSSGETPDVDAAPDDPDAWEEPEWADTAAERPHAERSEYAESAPDLRAHLIDQLVLERFASRDYAIALALVDALDDDGYLRESMAEIAGELKILAPAPSEVEIEAILQRVQRLDPLGVGARTPEECLLLQLEVLPADTPGLDVARCLLEHHFARLARAEVPELARLGATDIETVHAALALIHGLNPRPGADFSPATTEYLVPELRVRRRASGWQVEPCPGMYPRLSINETYTAWLSAHRDSDGSEVLSRQLEEARWLLRSLVQREQTLLRVARILVQRQSAFFEHGPMHLSPLTLREVANELDMHESTISRAVQGKTIATPRGVFALRHLFSTALSNVNEQTVSSHAVRERLRHLLNAEDAVAPLSDAALAAALASEGMSVARRTVAKYREALGFASTRERRRPAHSTTSSKGKRHANSDHRSSSGNHVGTEGLRQHQAGTP